MKVRFMCTYYSQWAHERLAPRNQGQWDALKFCRAVKNRRINGSTTFPWNKGPEIINTSNVGRARWIFGFYIHSVLKDNGLHNAVLVPIPSKDGLVAEQKFRSLEMVQEALADHGKFTICPCLRFTEALTPASKGGPRGRDAIKPFLQVVGSIPAGPVVLVDDITTTGGSILASADRLIEAGRPPRLAIVCGHTVSDSLLAPFGNHAKAVDLEHDGFL